MSLQPVKRRLACPQTVLKMWDALETIRHQKQITTSDRVAKFMHRIHNLSPEDSDRQLSFAVKDGLILKKTAVGCKGSKAGVEQEAYRLPTENQELDGHDWYCFECHRGGDAILCAKCYRVYHSFCVKEDLTTSSTFICSVCKLLTSKTIFKMSPDEMNSLLSYTCLRLKDKVIGKKEHRTPEDPNLTRDLHRMPSTEEEVWRSNFLIYHKMDLLTMEEKARANEYRRLEEFQADAQTIVHNVVIYYGVHSSMADMARQMLRDCIYDLGEIRQCRECYRMSNEKGDRFWFCEPCDPPHELVYAKQKGFPYWPAKVIRKNMGVYDVRFFGGHHQRANIEKDQIRPIETSLQALGIKRSSGFNKALEELKRHQEMLEECKTAPKTSNNKRKASPAARIPKKAAAKAYQESTDEDANESDNDAPVAKKRTVTKPATVPRGRPGRPPKNSAKASKATVSHAPPSPQAILPHIPSPVSIIDGVVIKEENSDSEGETVNGEDEEETSRDAAPSSSSQKKSRKAVVNSQEDNNVVTSSSQESPYARISVATQTHKKLLTALIAKEVALKTNSNAAAVAEPEPTCNCEAKYAKLMQEQEEKLELEHKKENERMRQELRERLLSEFEVEKNKEITLKLEKMQTEFEQRQRKEEDQLRLLNQQDLNEVQERLTQEISETKKKQWCYNCEQEAIYHCCWNTSYCSVECQQTHWHREHKRTCRRKR